MAAIALIEQHVIFIKVANTTIDENAILASTLVQALATNSQGGDLIMEYHNYMNWNGTVWTPNVFLELKCYITAAFQTTVQANIPALQSAFPQYTVVTWGNPTTFGN
jgi:hypothetical protein